MNQGDMEVLAKAFAPVLREMVRDAVKPIAERLLLLEAREPLQGEPGEPGADGFGLDDFDIEKGEDARTLVLKFQRGETSHEYEVTFPVPIYCGVFKEGSQYKKGDLVTWGGELWHCDTDTQAKPGTEDWTRTVRKGRDGKDAKNG